MSPPTDARERTVPRPLHAADPPSLGRVAFVLLRTSHPGNVGAAARAMRTMGLVDLRLVAPRHDDAARYLCSIVHFPAESFANASDCRYCFDGSAALR